MEVIDEIKNIEQIGENVAPWVKIKIPDGKEGYIFGVFVKKEGEFYP